jgi:hypothetical protein
MWYVLPDSNKQYPLTIERVRKIRQMNMQNVVADDLGPVEVNTGKPKEETETGFVDLVGQISLKTLEKADRKKRHGHKHGSQHGRGDGGSQQGRDGGSQGRDGGQQGNGGRPVARDGAGRDNNNNPGNNKEPKKGGPPSTPPPPGRHRRR